MSGIAAIFNLDGAPAEAAVLDRMLAATPYRGPDGCGRFVSGPLALGHVMLRCTPESEAETQPLADQSGQIVLSLDGRVDNRDELSRALTDVGFVPRTGTDAELVLCAYQAWGAEAPRRIIGDFAFVVWDGARRRMLCARDIFGVRAFYYHHGRQAFLCASELHQLFADPRVPREPNEGMIGEIAAQMPANREETIFRGVLRLPPRHALMVSADGFRIWRYYDPDTSAEIRYRTDAEYAEHFRALFTDSVRERLRCVKRVMIDVSGGLDSSSIFCAALKILRSGAASAEIEAVSLARHPDSDETSYLAAIERETGISATVVDPADAGYPALAAQCRHYLDLPDYPNAAMGDYDSLIAARGDFRVRLTGVGGDEWLTGSAYAYADMLRRFQLGAIAARLRLDYALARSDPFVAPLGTLLISGVWPFIPRRARLLARHWLLPDAPHANPLTREFAHRIGLAERVRVEEPAPKFPNFAQQDIYHTFTAGWLAHPLEMNDRWMAARGLDGRHPFLDRRIFEFALAIPEAQRTRDGVERYVVRNAMRGLLPEEIRTRRVKATYASCFPGTLEKAGGARVFESMETVRMGWFNGEWLTQSYAAMMSLYRAGDPLYMVNARPLWMAFAIELWFKNVFVKAHSIAPENSVCAVAG
jgi:asparagine synthase (glutamine-hydrolysing)